MRELLRRLWYLLNRRRLEREMAEEMAYHREQMLRDGRQDFGSDLRLQEVTREVWGWAWLDRLRQDIVYGARILRHSAGFTVTAMLVLGLGIGVPLTAFRAMLADLRADSVPDPDTLVQLTRRAPGTLMSMFPYPLLDFYAGSSRSFRSVIGLSDRNQAVFGETAAGAAPEEVRLAFATANYFPEFGIVPARGRLLTASDGRGDAEPAALVGETFWQNRLGGDSGVIGRSIRLNGKPVRVVGVVPRSVKTSAEVWMTMASQPYVIEGSHLTTDWNSAIELYGRLKSGVSPQAAEAETKALAAGLRAIRPDRVLEGEYMGARPIHQLETDKREFQIVLTAAALVLLLLVAACANLGTLVLARGVSREREIRIRMALGAGRPRVVRQLFTESLLLAALSAVCALVLSSVALKAIQLQHNADASVLPDWPVLAVTFGTALLAALVFGLPPALRLTTLVPHAGRARPIFLAAQVAASCLLLVVSSLLVNSLRRLGNIDSGFDYRHLVWISPGLKAHGYSGAAAQAYLDALRAQVIGMQDVKAASVVWLGPWGDTHMGSSWMGRQYGGNHVDPRFLDTAGIRLLRGRNLRSGEAGVALISEGTARALWPDGDALGKALPWEQNGPTVIGVVRNASTTAIGNPDPREFYLPLAQAEVAESVLLVRVSGAASDSARRLQDAARGLDGRLQPSVVSVTDRYNREVENLGRVLAAVTMLGLVAILLSVIGLAGLAGYAVAQRTREFGLRLALGARVHQIIRAVLSPMGAPLAWGFVCGAVGATAVAKVLRSGIASMAGLGLFDPLAYLMASVFFAAVVAVAILAPTRRALRISPAKALQHE